MLGITDTGTLQNLRGSNGTPTEQHFFFSKDLEWLRGTLSLKILDAYSLLAIK